MNESGNRSTAESQFRRSGRWLAIVLIVIFPVAVLSSKLGDYLHTDLPVGLSLTLLMVLLTCVCVWRYTAYCRWTGKHPFYWLRRK